MRIDQAGSSPHEYRNFTKSLEARSGVKLRHVKRRGWKAKVGSSTVWTWKNVRVTKDRHGWHTAELFRPYTKGAKILSIS